MERYPTFPETRWTAIRALKSSEEQTKKLALDVVAALYRQPVYVYVRAKWNVSHQDAEDAAQAFFVHALEKEVFEKFDPDQARFRTFLRACLDRFLINLHKMETSQKRGGGVGVVSIGEREDGTPIDPADPHSLEAQFDFEWKRSLFESALSDLETESVTEIQKRQLAVFRRYDLERKPDEKLTYALLAEEFSVTVATVTNDLFTARTILKRALLERLRSVTASDEEFLMESRLLLGSS